MTRNGLRVLVIAESANPDWSSVALIGWSLSRALLEHVDGHVVTHIENRDALRKMGWTEGREFTAIDPGAIEDPINQVSDVVRKVLRLGWTWRTALSSVYYYYFEHLVWRRFGEALRSGAFDIVHRITPISPVTPSLIVARGCRSARVPFVWGPVNGGVAWPKDFRGVLQREGEWLSYVRGAHRLLPGYAVTRSAAAGVIAGSVAVWDQMKGHQERCVYLPENAIEPERFALTEPASAPREAPLRVAFVGRLVPYKGADMLLEAAAPLIRSGRLQVELIGDGPEMASLRRQVVEAQIGHGVTFSGWIDHREVAKRLARSEVFALPSIREFGGGVVLEAMALGLAPVVVDYGGPGELVTDETGFRIPLGPRDSVVAAFRQTLEELAASPGRARRIGAQARSRVYRLFTWDAKARQILEVYRWVLNERGKPDFGMPLR
jgi:glycosyltransferase involved in cell wall biosynthesis